MHTLYRNLNYSNIKLDDTPNGQGVGVLRRDRTVRTVTWLGFIHSTNTRLSSGRFVKLRISREDGMDLKRGEYVHVCRVSYGVYALVDTHVAIICQSTPSQPSAQTAVPARLFAGLIADALPCWGSYSLIQFVTGNASVIQPLTRAMRFSGFPSGALPSLPISTPVILPSYRACPFCPENLCSAETRPCSQEPRLRVEALNKAHHRGSATTHFCQHGYARHAGGEFPKTPPSDVAVHAADPVP